jgi:uncharacterized membrane protein
MPDVRTPSGTRPFLNEPDTGEWNMIPNPLHPAVVHFPIVLAVLLPLVAAVALVAIRRGGSVRQWWGMTLAVMLGLAASSFAAVRTGEAEEDRVERAVGEQPLHAHEEAGERFLVLTGALLVIGAAGLLPKRAGAAFRLVGAAATAGVLVAGWQVGHTGGQLVYQHGAAAAYGAAGPGPDGGRVPAVVRRRDRDDDR